MRIGMRQVSSETVEWLGTACRGGDLTGIAPARGPFGRESRYGRAGGLCLASVRRLLPTPAEGLGARLPEAEATAPGPHARPAPDFPDSSVARALGGIGLSAAGVRSGPRDRFVGWPADARAAGIGRAVRSNRFLLLPGVRAAVCDGRPVPATAFTGPEMSGPVRRAAGWRRCPEPAPGRRSGARRAVWSRQLPEGWREALRRGPERAAGRSGSMYGERERAR